MFLGRQMIAARSKPTICTVAVVTGSKGLMVKLAIFPKPSPIIVSQSLLKQQAKSSQ